MVNTAALYKVPTKKLKGKFYRYIRTKHAHEPLSVEGSIRNGGRYNVAGLFGALYLGFDLETCEAELSQGIAAGVPFKRGAFTAWSYDVSLKAVINLDDPDIQKKIHVKQPELTIQGNHWTASGIGEHLHKRGDIEGLTAPSAQLAAGKCLDVFLDRIRKTSYVNPVQRVGIWP